jgi:hypothetical protein
LYGKRRKAGKRNQNKNFIGALKRNAKRFGLFEKGIKSKARKNSTN